MAKAVCIPLDAIGSCLFVATRVIDVPVQRSSWSEDLPIKIRVMFAPVKYVTITAIDTITASHSTWRSQIWKFIMVLTWWLWNCNPCGTEGQEKKCV